MRQNMVGFTSLRTLLDVGDFGFQSGLVILVHRKGTQALAALFAHVNRPLHQFVAIAQHA